uniref:Iron hydrogenase large subunit C-terminal domain-containing protein n=1 Tax=Entomoneis paludosa TaxID=265537 RepID=A0A7S2YRN1_9STRA
MAPIAESMNGVTSVAAGGTLLSAISSNSNAALSNDTSSRQTDNTTAFVYGSGGYANYIFRHACHELYGVSVAPDQVPWEPGNWNPTSAGSVEAAAPRSARMAAMQRRNKDFFQAILYRRENHDQQQISYVLGSEAKSPLPPGSTQEPVLRFALAYGMQTLQRMLKPFTNDKVNGTFSSKDSEAAIPFDYVEAMACPSGCVNGGGQIGLNRKETPTETRTRLSQTRKYFTIPPRVTSEQTQENTCPIPKEDRHTTYHVVPPMQLSMGAAAGMAVEDIQW